MPVSTIAYEGNSFDKFLIWTDEKQVLGSKIREMVKPGYETLLDVGAGTGDLTEHYAHLFRKIVLVEPASGNARLLATRFANATLIVSKIEEFRPPDLAFDMIVASHVLIYVEHPMDAIDRLFSSLRPEGRLVIVMLDRNCAYLKFVDEFYERVLGSQDPRLSRETHWEIIAEHCVGRDIRINITQAVSMLNVPSVEDFLSMNDFHFNTNVNDLDSGVLEDMRIYLSGHRSNGNISLDIRHKIMVLEK